jgi:PKD repeat protein
MSWLASSDTPEFVNPEGFETGVFPPPGWEIKVSDDLTTQPVAIDPSKPTWGSIANMEYVHTGYFSAAISYKKKKSNWLITPSITVEANKELSYFVHFTGSSSFFGTVYTSKFDILVKDGDTNWKILKTYDGTSGNFIMLNEQTIDLSAYSGKSVKIAFVQSYTDGSGIAIDDVKIQDKSSKAKTNNKTKRFLKEELSNPFAIQNQKIVREGFRCNTDYTTNTERTTETPTGFKVYVDDVFKAELAADVRSYVIKDVDPADYDCAVSAMYGTEESDKTEAIEVTTIAPSVDFRSDKKVAGPGETVNFTAVVRGSYKTLNWNFGDASTPSTSENENVAVTYSSLGKKDVSVTINGNITKTVDKYIVIRPGQAGVNPNKCLMADADYNNITVSWPSLTFEATFAEDFEGDKFPPEGWEIKKSATIDGALTDPTGDENIWIHNEASSFGGDGEDLIKTGKRSTGIHYETKNHTWLITKPIAITENDKLRFWLFYKNAFAGGVVYSYTDFKVIVNADGKWNEALYYTDGTPSNYMERMVEIDLNAYAGKDVKIAFVYIYTDGWQMGLDNIKIGKDKPVSRSLADNFTKLKIYRDDIVVKEITDPAENSWTDTGLETGVYKYYVTVVNADDNESYPSEEKFVTAYKTKSIPYSEDFESGASDFIFSTGGSHLLKIGSNGDFAKESYEIPHRDGKYVAVNTSDIKNSYFGYSDRGDILPLTPLNLSGIGRGYLEMDYVSDMPTFAVVGRANPKSKWTVIKHISNSASWKKVKVDLSGETLKNGYQLGIYFANERKASKGVAFDDIKVTSLDGKHIELTFGSDVVTTCADQYLGKIKEGTTKDFTVKVTNIGNEDIAVGNITVAAGKFTLKSSPANSTLAVNESANVVLTYTPSGLTTTADEALLTINSDAADSPYTVNVKAECGLSTWTYMLYLYEDGTGLDGNKDFNEWEVLGSIPGKVNYLVLFDANDDEKDGIYYVKKDTDGFNTYLVSDKISTELNADLDMNEYKTLEKFILWGKENYPAEHYGCNVWDHGTGIFRSGRQLWRSACGDMKVWDLAKALKAFKDVDGKGFDIFGFDVCLLGQVETVYDIKDYTDIVIASEKTEPADGWHYTTHFQPLNDNPDIDKYQLADHIIVKYDESYNDGIQGDAATTQSAIRTDKFKAEFIPALNAFAEQIIPEMHKINSDIIDAVDNAWYSDGDDYIEHKDLGHFLELLKAKSSVSAETKSKIDDLVTAYNASIIRTEQNKRPNATGLKIWIPKDLSANDNAKYYTNADEYLKMPETKWDEFIAMIENPVVYGEPKPEFDALGAVSIAKYGTVKFKDITEVVPAATSRTWSVTPATFEFVNGTDENSETVEIKFNEAGTYSVKLSVTNSQGTGELNKDDVVTVRELVFLAPTNLNANVDAKTRKVSLTWQKPVDDSYNTDKLDEDFEKDEWPATGWTVKYSKTIDGAHQEPADPKKTWFHCDENSFGKDGKPDPQYIKEGKFSAAIGYTAPEFNWLITPEITVADNDQLTFWLWYNNGESSGTYYYTNFRVMVLDGNAWKQELFYTNGGDPNIYKTKVNVDLAKYTGKSVKLAFVYEYTDGYQLAIDNVKVVEKDSRAGVADGTLAKYYVYRKKEKVAETTETTFSETLPDVSDTYEYYVTAVYTDPTGESEPSQSTFVKITKSGGTSDIEEDKYLISLYPNPSGGNFTIEATGLEGTYTIINPLGKTVTQGLINAERTNVTIPNPITGIYLIKIVCGTEIVTKKLFIQ